MQNGLYSDSGEDSRDLNSEAQSLDDLLNKAVEAAAKGENVEQLLEVMLVELPANAKDKARKKFAALLAKRGLRQPSNEVADIPSRATLSRIRAALAISTRQMMDRIRQLVSSRPDIASTIQQAGAALVQNGVLAGKVTQVNEGELGTMAPLATGAAKPQQDRGSGRST